MTARSSYKLCRAVLKKRDPVLTSLFHRDDILYNKDFHIACPFNHDAKNPFDCQPKYILKAPCSSIISRLDMPRHLRDVHHVYRAAALKIVAEMRRCSKTSDTAKTGWKLNRNLFEKQENIIESFDEKDSPQVSKWRDFDWHRLISLDAKTRQTTEMIARRRASRRVLNSQITMFCSIFFQAIFVICSYLCSCIQWWWRWYLFVRILPLCIAFSNSILDEERRRRAIERSLQWSSHGCLRLSRCLRSLSSLRRSEWTFQ